MSETSIIIVDDHKIVRDGIRSLLSEEKSYDIIGEASNGNDALNLLTKLNPDIMLIDINMPGMNGIECTHSIMEKYPHMKILALSMHNEEPHIRAMVEAGASGYILKNSGREELVNAITTIMGGSTYFSEEVKESVMNSLIHKKAGEAGGKATISLSERELEVLQLIVKEFTNSEIAEKLFLSPRTVDAHRRNLLEKTGSRNTAGLVRYAIEKGLLD